MKIFIIGPRWHGHSTEYCEKAFINLGMEVYVFYYAGDMRFTFCQKLVNKLFQYLPPAYEASRTKEKIQKMNESLMREAIQQKPDLIFIYKGETVHKEVLSEVKNKTKAKIATWWVDDPFRYPEVIKCAELFDYFFVFDSYHIERLNNAGMRQVHFLPCACDSDVFRKIEMSEKERCFYGSDISFVGDSNDRREEVLGALVDYNMKIWGTVWKKSKLRSYSPVKRNVLPDELNKIYNNSKININIHHMQSVYGTNSRTFEIASSGGFQLTDYKSDIRNLFKINSEIVCYEDINELREKVKYYLKHDAEREKIAISGMERSRRDHTYLNRMREVIKIVQV